MGKGRPWDGWKDLSLGKRTSILFSDNFLVCSGADTRKVGSYAAGASPYGALDMAVTYGSG